METSRIALIRYDSPDGNPCVASGLLVSDRHVLTADHAAGGTRHRVVCSGAEIDAIPMLRTHDQSVDLAVLTLAKPVKITAQPLPCGQVDRRQWERLPECVTVGYPRWKKDGDRRLTAEVVGSIPVAEGLDPDADAAQRDGFLTLVGDRNPPALPIPQGDLSEYGNSQWGGMSGAGVVYKNFLIGVVRSHNSAAGGQSLTITPLTAIERLPSPLQQQFRAVLGIERPVLPVVTLAAPSGVAGGVSAPALSPDAQDRYRPVLSAKLAPYGLPVDWTLDELSALRRKAEADGLDRCKEIDLLTALCEALGAKAVFLELDGDHRLGLEELQVVYEREIGALPDGSTADVLLVEAANVGIAERNAGKSGPLGALTRFMIGIAARLKVPPEDCDLLAHWVESMGKLLANAQEHYDQRLHDQAWLVINLGDEPRNGVPPWPHVVNWMLVTGEDPIPGPPVPCEPHADGLRQALAHVMRHVQSLPARRLVVDLVVPRALMDEGIEHWPVIDVDDVTEPLSAWHRPRLRWTRRHLDRNGWLYKRLLDRTENASWHGEAEHWTRNDPLHACFLGGRDARLAEDPLRNLLREGGGFAIWFPSGLQEAALREIGKAVRGVPERDRRRSLPDHLPRFETAAPAIIWDDPLGRSGFKLPPLVAPESPNVTQEALRAMEHFHRLRRTQLARCLEPDTRTAAMARPRDCENPVRRNP